MKEQGGPWSWQFLEALTFAIRYAFRQLHKSPAFVIAVVLTRALAIGANTAIFSEVSAVLLQSRRIKTPSVAVRSVQGFGSQW